MTEQQQQLAEAKTKLPQKTLDVINDALREKGITMYEYLQICCALVLRYNAPDCYWQQMTEPVKSAVLEALMQFLSNPDDKLVHAVRQSMGMVVSDRVDDSIESATVTLHGGATFTVQNPGLFAEFSTSLNDSYSSLINADPPMRCVMRQLQERHPDATIADLLLTALSDMLEVEQGQPVGEYASNVYGRVPVRHPNVKR